MTRPETNPTLLVFSDDWGRHPSSCQHLVGQLLPRQQVCWVNTIGMRRPSLNLMTARRAFEKVGHWFSSRSDESRQLPDNLTVINPKMWPWYSWSRDRWINQKLLTRQLTATINQLGHSVTAVTTIPIVADLIDRLPVNHWVYYCVDDFSVWPGLDQEPMRQMERLLIDKADRLISVSATLQEKLKQYGRQSHLLTHGVDLEFWKSNPPEGMDSVEGLQEPLIVFWGVVDQRMDAEFVNRLANDLQTGTILLVGPEQDPDPKLTQHPRIARLPAVAYEQLPAIAQRATVLIMPYRDLPVTRAMQPLKLKEYLATGKPVVIRGLPATDEWSDCLDVTHSPEEFSQIVRARLNGQTPPDQLKKRRRLEQESWKAKARQFEQIVFPPDLSPAPPDVHLEVGWEMAKQQGAPS